MPQLFAPLRLRDLTLPNRVMVSPMCQYTCDDDGRANDWHLMHVLNLAAGGAGLVCLEGTAVEPIGRITPSDLGLWDDETETALARVVGAVRTYTKSRLAIQLAHAGRKGSSRRPWDGGQLIPLDEGGWETCAPSAVPHKPDERAPRAMDRGEMDRVREAFVAAARRADRMGFDAVEIHGAHGYLIHEFLSPLANHRDDDYGGALENRMRYPLEIVAAVRAALDPRKPLGVKVSAIDWVDGGWDLDQCVVFARALKALGVDWITASSAGVSPRQQIQEGPGYQVPYAARIKAEVGLPTIAVGLITAPQLAEAIVRDGKADMVALARAMLYDPRWAWHAAAELGATVDAPPQYQRSQPRELKGLFGDFRMGMR